MKFLKLDLLTLLISLFLFASCESTSTIGLEVDPTSAIQGSLIDTATITSRTVLDDDGPTYGGGAGLSAYPLGFLKDPILGEAESSVALSVNLPLEGYSFGNTPVLDSAVLVLNFGKEFYGDSTATYTIDVHQLTNNINKEASYLSKNTYPYESAVLGNYTNKIFPNTPFKVKDIVSGGVDTLQTVKPQLRVKLDPTFIINNVVAVPSTSLKYNAYFQAAFKGLQVQIKASSKAGVTNGGIMFLDFANTSTSGLILYYKRKNAGNVALTDSVTVNFPIAVGVGAVAASVKHTYSAAVQAQLSAPNVQQSVTYLQALGGLRNKLAFPYLKKLKAAVGKMVVNKAELVIDLSSATDVAPFKAAPRLALYRYDIAGQRKNLPDNDGGDGYSTYGDRRANPGAFGGYFDSVNKRYVFIVTAYVQDLIDEKTENYGTFLAVTPSTAFQFTPSFNVASRAVVGSFKKTPLAGDKLMKLNIYYTKTN